MCVDFLQGPKEVERADIIGIGNTDCDCCILVQDFASENVRKRFLTDP